MKAIINEKTALAQYSIRAFMLFESITGRVFQGGTVTDEVTMMYATFMSSCQELTFKEMVDYIDEHPGALVEWRKWFGEEAEKQAALIAAEADDEKKN